MGADSLVLSCFRSQRAHYFILTRRLLRQLAHLHYGSTSNATTYDTRRR